MNGFLKWAGAALCLAAILLVVINAGLTPQLPHGAFSEIAASDIFFLRQCLAAAAALLCAVGVTGLFAAQLHRLGFFGHLAFFLALAGSVALFATEWAQIFVVRDIALSNPAAIDQMENREGFTLFDIGALAAFAAFSLGWVFMAISMLFTRVFSRLSAALLLAAFFVTPMLGPFGVWGAAAGSALIGLSWFWLGAQLMGQRRTLEAH